jgi:hypothetical protein
MISFECDICIFCKLWDQSAPDLYNPIDSLLMLSIRRMNLDALWSRASSTVEGNAGMVARCLRHSKLLGLTGPYSAIGPLPYYDHCGYEVALQLLTDSRERGSYQLTHKQFDTIRNLRLAYSNQVRSSAQVAAIQWMWRRTKVKDTRALLKTPQHLCVLRDSLKGVNVGSVKTLAQTEALAMT